MKNPEEASQTLTNPDEYYGLTGTCRGCRRVSWLCRRHRRCTRYNAKPKKGHVARPSGYYPQETERSETVEPTQSQTMKRVGETDGTQGNKLKHFLLVVWGDIEPEISGPFENEEERDREAQRLRKENGNDHGIFPMECETMPEISTYSGGFFLDDQNQNN
jgi:hypothetical protein